MGALLEMLESRTLFSVSPIGSLDAATVNAIAGWAYDGDDPNARLTVNVKIVDNGHTTSVTANSARPDLTMLPDIYHGYGFSFGGTILTEIAPSSSRTISATAVSVGGGADTTFPTITVTNHLVGGSVDIVNGKTIAGWAYDPDTGSNAFAPDGTGPIYIDVIVNGVAVSRRLANVRREDLVGQTFGPNHGYSVDLSGLSFTSAPSYQVWFEDSTALYSGSPFGTLARSGTLPPVLGAMSPQITGAATNATSVVFKLNFSQPVTGVDVTDFQAVSGLSGVSVSSVSGSGSEYYVTVAAGTDVATGTLQLNLVDNDSIVGGTGVPLAGSGASNGNFTGSIVTVDRVVPSLSTVTTSSPSTITAGTNITWVVTFSEAVTGVDTTDFRGENIVGVVPGAVVSVVAVNGTTYNVTINSGSIISGSSFSQIGLRLVDDDSIRDVAGNVFGGIGDNSRTSGPFITLV
jgi:hypothetical protein